jgi:Holliday junction DNA helicase RuvA
VIGHLNGTILRDGVVDVGGVGWVVKYPGVYEVGTVVSLYVTSVWVRDGGPVLYGFSSVDEQLLFKALCKVPKVGAAAAISLLRAHGSEGIVGFIVGRDATGLSRAPGVGVKTADQIISQIVLPVGAVGVVREGDALVDTLVTLGYSDKTSTDALAYAREQEPEADEAGLLKLAISYARTLP